MQRIVEYLKDPGWWFSAFFVAILASLLAAFLRDWLGGALSRLSTRYRRYRLRRLRLSAHTIRNIALDPGYMVFFTVRHLSFLLLGILLFIAFVAADEQFTEPTWLGIGIRLLITAMQVRTVFKAREWGRELTRGMKRYKKRRGLYDVNHPA